MNTEVFDANIVGAGQAGPGTSARPSGSHNAGTSSASAADTHRIRGAAILGMNGDEVVPTLPQPLKLA